MCATARSSNVVQQVQDIADMNLRDAQRPDLITDQERPAAGIFHNTVSMLTLRDMARHALGTL